MSVLRGSTVLSYGSKRDSGRGTLLCSTEPLGQLKEATPHCNTNRALLAGPHGGTVKDLLTAGGHEDAMETEGAAKGLTTEQLVMQSVK